MCERLFFPFGEVSFRLRLSLRPNSWHLYRIPYFSGVAFCFCWLCTECESHRPGTPSFCCPFLETWGLTRTGSLSLFASPWPFSLPGNSHTWYSMCCACCCHVWVMSRHEQRGFSPRGGPKQVRQEKSWQLRPACPYNSLSKSNAS